MEHFNVFFQLKYFLHSLVASSNIFPTQIFLMPLQDTLHYFSHSINFHAHL